MKIMRDSGDRTWEYNRQKETPEVWNRAVAVEAIIDEKKAFLS